MAANISIDAEKAEIWVKDVEAEIEEVNGVLNRVTGVLTTVAGDDDTSLFVQYGIRIHHGTVDFHCAYIFRNKQYIPLAQHHIIIRTRIFQSLIQMNTYRIYI